MKKDITIDCMGYAVGGFGKTFEIDIDDLLLEGLSEEEIRAFILEEASEMIEEHLEINIID
jgi:hypothetical protein